MWGAVISAIGSAVGGLFNFKAKQGDVVVKALEGLQSVSDSDRSQAQASADAISAVYQRGNMLERSWRPLFMYVCMGLIIARWFGYVPTHLGPAEVEHLYTFLYIGIGGYIPLRSLDKWMLGFQVGALLKTYVQKKLS